VVDVECRRWLGLGWMMRGWDGVIRRKGRGFWLMEFFSIFGSGALRHTEDEYLPPAVDLTVI
jgi:hypothetical protein